MTASLIRFIIRLANEFNHQCVFPHIFMLAGLFVFILLCAMQLFAGAARHMHFCRFSQERWPADPRSQFSTRRARTHTGVTVCRLIKIAGSFGIVRSEHGEEWEREKWIEWLWLREMDECSDKRSCLGPDRYTQQMDDSYLGDHRVHTHA